MRAAVVIERDGTVHEQPDHERLDGLYPLEGKVYSCEHRATQTFLSVYQTIPNLFSFPNLSHHRAFLIIPEFWNFLEERSEWRDLLPRGMQVRELRKKRYKHPDIADTAWAIHRYTRMSGIFAGDEVRQINGRIFTKIEQLHRLMRRIEHGNRLKLHLLTLSNSEGRSYVLDELVNEGPMTLEHAAFAAYAVLDLTALLLNHVLQIGISELNVSFTALLGKDSADPSEVNLRTRFANLPLTQFWLTEQAEWIAVLRDMRHEFAHRGASSPVYGPNDRLLAMSFNVPAADVAPIHDVGEVVTGWFSRSERFFTESLRLLADHCKEAVKAFESSPVKPPIQAPKPSSDLAETLSETLRLLFAKNDEQPNRVDYLYARLERKWRKKWPIAKFRAFINAVDVVALAPGFPVGFSSDGDSSGATAKIVLSMAGKLLPWILKLNKLSESKASLVLTPMTVPLNVAEQTSVDGYSAKQSGRETGHSCAEFRFAVTNTGTSTLRNVSVVIANSDLEVASAEIGDLDAGASVPVFATTTPEIGRILPPGGPYMFVTLISEPVSVRVVYDLETDLGNCWADEHRCSNPKRTSSSQP